ncbi:MAG: redoxin domain-containing protein, partial [Anaerolineae bacterium]|nr:redoxin domain-containing protein [Anaerolineae bacterium]
MNKIPYLLIILSCLLFLAACTGSSTLAEPTIANSAPTTTMPADSTPTLVESAAATAVPTPPDTLAAEIPMEETPMKADLPDLGPAPEFKNDTWLNSEVPISLASLRGKVVLVEFWTFGCINCQRTTPWIKAWHEQYTGDDFAVVTIHYPEFSFERDIDNVANALAENEITYPVAIDN